MVGIKDEFLTDFPQYKNPKKKYKKCNLDEIYLDAERRYIANKRIFPYFASNKVNRKLVAQLISWIPIL
jgi:hypothetical protein